MNKKLLTTALLVGVTVAGAVSAQEFDDRWYLTGAVGFNMQDNKRTTNDAPAFSVGLGKFISRDWSLDVELNYQNPNFDKNQDVNWPQYGGSIDLRRHFVVDDRGWNPYVLFGMGLQRTEEGNPANAFVKRKENNFAAKAGFGVQTTLEKRVGVRAEVAYRVDFDDQSNAGNINGRDTSHFGDVLASVGVVLPLGPRAQAPIVETPEIVPPKQEVSCKDLDDDRDGVNNCIDKCPNSKPGETIGPDGCPVIVTIDLKGVNFDFDKATLRPDAVNILREAVEILKRYPDMRVEVAGHTDSKGPAAYNQKLSERRAKTVYDYLTNNGIASSRLVGPVGYGLTRPIAPNTLDNGRDNPEGRAKNRRTELNSVK